MSLKKLKVVMSIMIIMILTAGITQSVYARNRDVLLSIPAQIELSHCTHAEHNDQMFRIQLQAVGNAPQQENSEINVSRNTRKEFLMSFQELGNYQYQIRQISDNNHFQCDETVFDLFVQVIIDSNDELAVNAWVTKHGSDQKLNQVTFKNICSDNSGTPGDSDKPGDSIKQSDGKTKNIKTGDDAEITLWAILALIGALGIVKNYRKIRKGLSGNRQF